MTASHTLPVQHCPICRAPGVRLQTRQPLPLDAQCTACGWYYTSTAHRMVLRALTSRPDWRAEVR
jgi:hypothetical protein